MIAIREGTEADFRAYVGGAGFDPEWCQTEPSGLVVESEGGVVAVAIVTEDAAGRTWIWHHSRAALSAVAFHRSAVLLLDKLRRRRVAEVFAFPERGSPTAQNWLSRLGFSPREELPHPSGDGRQAWAAVLN